MSDSSTLWRLRSRELLRARKLLRAGDPEGLHDVRVALRRAAATAGALGRRKVERRSKKIASSLSERRQLEVDRAFLSRLERLGLLSNDAATVLEARWRQSEDERRRMARIGNGKRMRRLVRKLRSLAARSEAAPVERLVEERAQAEAELAALLPADDDETLHRYRLGLKRARYIAEDLANCGLVEFESVASREKAGQDLLGHWNDLRLFIERIDRERELALRRGAVRLASELDGLARALVGPLKTLRTEAIQAVRRLSRGPSAHARSA